MAKQERYKTF